MRKLPIMPREDPNFVHSDTELEMGPSSRATLVCPLVTMHVPRHPLPTRRHTQSVVRLLSSLSLPPPSILTTPTSPCDHTHLLLVEPTDDRGAADGPCPAPCSGQVRQLPEDYDEVVQQGSTREEAARCALVGR